MTRMVVKSVVSSDGVLHLHLPIGMADADKEVQVTVEPLARKKAVSESRSLTDAELALLRWLLTCGAAITGTDTKLATAFLSQIGAARVVGRCSCGCPSFDIALALPEKVVCGASTILADVEGLSPEGNQIGVILRLEDGMLAGVELYSRDGKVPFSIPGAEQLQTFW